MTLFDTLMLLIEKGRTDGLAAKVEKLHNGGKLTDEEYEKLMELLMEVAE